MPGMRGWAILVTGGTGFIGEHAVRRFVVLGATCGILARRMPETPPPPGVTIHQADLLDADMLPAILRRYDTVVHLAGRTGSGHLEDPVMDFKANALTTIYLLRASAEAKVRRFVTASSYEVYGPPQRVPIDEAHPTRPASPYGASALAREAYTDAFRQAFGLPTTTLRFFTVYGPAVSRRNQKGVISLFLDRVARGEPLTVTGRPWDQRDFVFVDDVVGSLAAILTAEGTIGEIINVGSGETASVADVVRLLAEHLDRPEVWTRFLAEHPAVPGAEIRADTTRLARLTGQAPCRSLADGIRAMVQARAAQVSR
jgi:UDP-glucose 4-epimerase